MAGMEHHFKIYLFMETDEDNSGRTSPDLISVFLDEEFKAAAGQTYGFEQTK